MVGGGGSRERIVVREMVGGGRSRERIVVREMVGGGGKWGGESK